MMKLMSFLLSALLVCGLTAMGSEENAPANQVRRLPVSVTLVEEEGIAAWAGASTPLSLKAQKNTEWSDDAGLRLMIYEDGAAYLFTANEVFALRESGDRFLLELSLYRTPFDAEPCLVLPAGAVRLLRDGSMVQVQVADDPLGVLAFDGLDGMVLTKQPYTPYRYPNFNFFSGPLEPGTDWFCYFNTGDHRYAILKMAIGEDGAMTGTLAMPDGRKMNCILLGNEGGYALADESGDAPELLFFGERTQVDDMRWDGIRYRLARLGLMPVQDYLNLCAVDRFELWREKTQGEDLRYMLGRNLDSVILSLLRDGWTDTTQELSESYPFVEEWFVRLTKDGQTLLIHCGSDYASPYEAWQNYPDAYVLYGADGAVLSWSGSKPIDHGLADAYKLRKGVYFDAGTGAYGMVVGEDSGAYFLDDGRIAVETSEHLGEGDVAFEIIRVIP